MKITGIHHIKFTVSNLEISKQFYAKLPGFKIVAEHPDFVMLSNNSLYIGLTTHEKDHTNKFDEMNIGLDHVAFELSNFDDLKEALEFLDKNEIKHNGIQKLSNDTHVIVFRDPDNIQLEFAYRKSNS